MKRSRAFAGVVTVVSLTGITAALASNDLGGRYESSPSTSVVVTAPGAKPTTTTVKPTPAGVRRKPSAMHWSGATFDGYCNVAGERVVTDWNDQGKTLPSFVNGGGSQTMFVSILVWNSDSLVVESSKIIKQCGNKINAPPPPNDESVTLDIENSGNVSLDSIDIYPTKGLTGLESEFTAHYSNAGTVTASNQFWSTTATITPVEFRWDSGEKRPQYASGEHAKLMYEQDSHDNPTVVKLTATFDVHYVVTGPYMTYSDNAPLTLTLTQPYKVISIRGVPCPDERDGGCEALNDDDD